MQSLIDKLQAKDDYLRIDHKDIENKVLDLAYHYLDNDAIEMISIAMQNNLDIKELNLSNVSLDYEGFEILAEGIAANKNITSLNLHNSNINDEKLELICEALILNTSLKKLNISDNEIKHDVEPLCKMIRDNENIQSLDISYNDIEDKSMRVIVNAIAVNNSIKELNLASMGRSGIQKIDLEVIKILSTNKYLSSINLSNNNIHAPQLVSVLECLADSKNIIALNLSQNFSLFQHNEFGSKISIEHREAICRMWANNNIKVLNLADTGLSNETLTILRDGIGNNTSIENLDLSKNSLGYNNHYQVVESLCDIISNNKVLKSLNLAKNHFSDKSLRLFINALDANNTMQVLDLAGHELGDRATKKLNNILQRNIDYAASADQEEDVLYSASEIALNENNECVMIGEMITDGTDNH